MICHVWLIPIHRRPALVIGAGHAEKRWGEGTGRRRGRKHCSGDVKTKMKYT